MTFSLSEVAAAIGAPGTPGPVPISEWSIDSRTIGQGALFVALHGETHDGHAHVAQAFEKGAAAAVVDGPVEASGSLLMVENTGRALEQLGRWARLMWGGDVVAVTGSAGKTTTKDVIAAMLALQMPVGKTAGNFNNRIGLPLSLLRLQEEAKVAVLEIGMNHSGEIRNLAQIVDPIRVGVVTNVGSAHIEFFDSIEGIAMAKRELIESLPSDGVAVLNADDPRVIRFRDAHSGPVITFGLSEGADVRATEVEESGDRVRFRVGKSILETSLAGSHGVRNILAGLAVARVYGITPEALSGVVRSLSSPRMRGERFQYAGITIFDDCYNSNPEAVRSMVDLLRATPARRRIAALGQMLELGRWSESLHREVGRYVAESGINVLVGIRGAARHMVDEAMKAGLAADAAYFFEDPVEAGDSLRQLARTGDAILFKGSRGTRVERALERFMERG